MAPKAAFLADEATATAMKQHGESVMAEEEDAVSAAMRVHRESVMAAAEIKRGSSTPQFLRGSVHAFKGAFTTRAKQKLAEHLPLAPSLPAVEAALSGIQVAIMKQQHHCSPSSETTLSDIQVAIMKQQHHCSPSSETALSDIQVAIMKQQQMDQQQDEPVIPRGFSLLSRRARSQASNRIPSKPESRKEVDMTPNHKVIWTLSSPLLTPLMFFSTPGSSWAKFGRVAVQRNMLL